MACCVLNNLGGTGMGWIRVWREDMLMRILSEQTHFEKVATNDINVGTKNGLHIVCLFLLCSEHVKVHQTCDIFLRIIWKLNISWKGNSFA